MWNISPNSSLWMHFEWQLFFFQYDFILLLATHYLTYLLLIYSSVCLSIYLSIYLFIYLFGERIREGEKHWCERETSVGCHCMCPDWGHNLQPRHVPWLGIEPMTFQFTGWESSHLRNNCQGLSPSLVLELEESVVFHLSELSDGTGVIIWSKLGKTGSFFHPGSKGRMWIWSC